MASDNDRRIWFETGQVDGSIPRYICGLCGQWDTASVQAIPHAEYCPMPQEQDFMQKLPAEAQRCG